MCTYIICILSQLYSNDLPAVNSYHCATVINENLSTDQDEMTAKHICMQRWYEYVVLRHLHPIISLFSSLLLSRSWGCYYRRARACCVAHHHRWSTFSPVQENVSSLSEQMVLAHAGMTWWFTCEWLQFFGQKITLGVLFFYYLLSLYT